MSSAGQNQSDQTANFFWMIAIVCGVFMVVWWKRPEWVVVPIIKMHLLELDIMIFFDSLWGTICGWFNIAAPSSIHTFKNIHSELLSVNPHLIKFEKFKLMNEIIGQWMRYPVMFILLVLAVILAFRHTALKYRTVHTMSSLKKVEVTNWPQITPVLDLDLVKQDLEKGPWAMAQTPSSFCKERGLLYTQQKNDITVYGLNSDATYKEIGLQVGRQWPGVQSLPIHIKALMVIFLARARRDRKLSNHLLAQISSSASSGKLDFTGVEEALEQLKNDSIIAWLEKRHGYIFTLLATLLELARSDGVLASAEFLWLKPVDRGLWYMLNSIGRQTAVIEAAGPFAHWLAEKRIGRAVKTPMVKEAIKALEIAVENILYVDESERWHHNAA